MDRNEFIKCVEEFKNGDESKFEIIYLETNNRLYNYIFSLSDALNNEDCIELVQDTYIQVNNKIVKLKDSKAFTSWMFMIAKNKTLRYLEKNKKEVLLSEEGQGIFENQLETDVDLLPQEILDNKEKQRMILDILDSLPKEQKEVIYLRYYNGLSVKQIAEKLSISDGTVKSRLNYGRKKIQAEVEALEKKGTKLYGITGLPFIYFLIRYLLQGEGISASKQQSMLNNIINSSRAMESVVSDAKSNIESEPYYNLDNSGYQSRANNPGVNNSINNVSSEILNNASKASGIKAIAAGVLAISIVAGGIFAYNNSKGKNESSLPEVVESQEDTQSTSSEISEDISDNETIRYEIEEYKSNVESLYNVVKSRNLMEDDNSEEWNIEYILSKIRLEDGGDGTLYYSSTYPMWCSQWIDSFIQEVEIAIEKKNKVSRMEDLSEKEKESIKATNNMIDYFLNNQQNLDELNNKLKEVSGHSGNEKAQEYASEFNKSFEEYKKLIEELR